MKGFLDIPYRLPFARHYKAFDRGFYVDFPFQLRLMGRWLREFGCRKTLDIGAMTGGCIEHISRLGIRMDGVQFTQDLKRLAVAQLKKNGVASTLYVSPVHAPLSLPQGLRYDGIVSLGWLNLPFTGRQLRLGLDRIRARLAPGGVFLFDFFDFKDLVMAPTGSQRLGKGLVHVSHGERRGKVLRCHHLWIQKGAKLRVETGDLVDRTPTHVRALLVASGLKLGKPRFLI